LSQFFKPRDYFVAESQKETTDLLRKFGDKARLIAGGTGIYEVAHRGLLAEVQVLVDITKLSLSYVRLEQKSLNLGSCTTMTSIFETAQLANHPELGALLDALRAIQPLQVKNVATVGGAICTALPFFDLPVSLIAMDTGVIVAPDNRAVKLEDFIQGYFSVDLRLGEFVREVRVPLSERAGSSFQKFALTGDDWAIMNCGSRIKIDKSNTISDAHLCFGGGVGERPKRATHLEQALHDVNPNDEAHLKAVIDGHIGEDIDPISDLKASSKYRIHLAKVLARRSILQSVKIAGELEHK
jgi:CO/xanthine dehydrogenase FAD-binding subunit